MLIEPILFWSVVIQFYKKPCNKNCTYTLNQHAKGATTKAWFQVNVKRMAMMDPFERNQIRILMTKQRMRRHRKSLSWIGFPMIVELKRSQARWLVLNEALLDQSPWRD